jgi:hypothetical protein
MVWYIFTKDVPLHVLGELREELNQEPEIEIMANRITDLRTMGGQSQVVGG